MQRNHQRTQLEDDSGEEKGATLTGERYGKRGPYKNYCKKPKMNEAERKMTKAKSDKKYMQKKKSTVAKDRASQQKLRGTILSKFSKGKFFGLLKENDALKKEIATLR